MDSSLWSDISTRDTLYPSLSEDLEVDVVIIGGGITGITAATKLIEAGKKVALIEAYRVGSGTTGNSTGNLYIPVAAYYQMVEKKLGYETASAIAHSRKFAIDAIEHNVNDYKLECHFYRRPWFAYTSGKEDKISLDKEVELFNKMEIPVEYTDVLPLDIPFKKAAVMHNQARFNPLQYVISLAASLQKKGCLIFENTRVIDLEENDLCTVQTINAKVTAKKVFIATHTPIGIHKEQFLTAPYRSYAMAVKLTNKTYPEGHFWDLSGNSPVISLHSIKSKKPGILTISGASHKTGQGNNMAHQFKKLEAFLYKKFDVSEISYQWSAQHYISADKAPYIGYAHNNSKHTFVASGFWADGLTYGTLAGILIADIIIGKNNPLVETYKPDRNTTVASAGFVLKENLNVFSQYLKDYPLFHSGKFSDVGKGKGKVLEINHEKYAVSRDDNNQLHVVSAVCTHMKCIVNWNDAEKTWDCPCHGSRFTCQGQVIEGPAMENLASKTDYIIDK